MYIDGWTDREELRVYKQTYTLTNEKELCKGRTVSGKLMILWKRRPRIVFCEIVSLFLVVRLKIALF